MDPLSAAIEAALGAGPVMAGAFYVWSGVAALRRVLPAIDGWWVVLAVAVLSGGVAVYQIHPTGAGALAITKHAGLLFIASYGGHNGLRKLLEYVKATIHSIRVGESLPPPPQPPEPTVEPAEQVKL